MRCFNESVASWKTKGSKSGNNTGIKRAENVAQREVIEKIKPGSDEVVYCLSNPDLRFEGEEKEYATREEAEMESKMDQ